ncbi:FAD-dependent oxidoreductase [Pseudomonas sp. nanlin1]|uniref:FAD-dependent oxidoreductase n=1 Tax=Pseudomonas sp. nanlin1 TaxID=3040605 RepID=UPI00388FFB95
MTEQRCDLLIVGSGPAGLAAAAAAASSGWRIVMVDDNARPGGQIWRHGPGHPPSAALRQRLAVLALANLRYLPATRIVASLGTGRLLLEDSERGFVLDYARLILCCGARERLLPFPGWTLPGVTGAGALQALLKNGLTLRRQAPLVVAGSGPLLLASAASARQAGAHVVKVLEQAEGLRVAAFAAQLWRWPGKVAQAAGLATRAYRCAAHVLEALGERRLQAVRIRVGEREWELPCEHLACGYGLVANTELGRHLGCAVSEDAIAVDAQQRTSVPQVYAAGECTGVGGSELAQIEGRIAGLVASDQAEQAQHLQAQRDHWQAFAKLLQHTFALNPAVLQLAQPDTLLCRCEDVPLHAVAGQPDWATAKLQSRCGMGACQGRICATAAQALFGWPLPAPQVPLVPARIATLLASSSPPEPP